MKSILFLSVLFSQFVLAEVVKPGSTMTTIKATTLVDQQAFDYMVMDRGWYTWGEFYPNYDITSEKTYVFDYESTQSNTTSEENLRADAENKCAELGKLDFDDFEKIPDINYTLKTWIDESRFYYYSEPKTLSGYLCLVHIYSKK